MKSLPSRWSTSWWMSRAQIPSPSIATGSPVEVRSLAARERRAVALEPQARDAEAALLGELLLLFARLGDHRIEHVSDVLVDVPRERAKAHPDLVRREPRAPLGVDGLQQVRNEEPHGVVDRRDGLARRPEYGVAR